LIFFNKLVAGEKFFTKLEISKLPAKLEADIELPASKSISNRLLILREIFDRSFEVENLSEARDTYILQKSLDKIRSHKDSSALEINVKDAGTAMRFLTAFLAARKGSYILTGDKRMQKRPIKPLVDALRSLGADISYLINEGYPPLMINGGKLKGGNIKIDASVSSQYISALLLIAPVMQNGIVIEPKNKIVSQPYIDITIKLLNKLGIEAGYILNGGWFVKQGKPLATKISVEKDWSSAAFWYCFAVLSEQADIKLKGLSLDSIQGDKIIANIYSNLGVESIAFDYGIKLIKPQYFYEHNIQLDLRNYPDLAPPIIVSLILLNINFRIKGLETLHLKESDRIKALSEELAKVGIKLIEKSNGVLTWEGQLLPFDKYKFETHNDHRIAMALSLFASVADVEIRNASVVSKSYPGFWRELNKFY